MQAGGASLRRPMPQEKDMAVREYNVVRSHEGDKLYKEGDVRTSNEADVKHLVDLGVLAPRPATGFKAEVAPLNKMEKAPASNKADYSSMTVSELKELAASRQVDLGDASKKGDVIAALELSDEATHHKA
jgi:multidrug efflux pump subunit AcrA (membrane-fusion protein)